jgi:hypothetical protein
MIFHVGARVGIPSGWRSPTTWRPRGSPRQNRCVRHVALPPGLSCGIPQLHAGAVYSARADLEYNRGYCQDAVELERTALRLSYTRPDPREISVSHHNLANYLFRTGAESGQQRAHRLAAALLAHLTGGTHELTTTLHALANDLRGDTDDRAGASVLPRHCPRSSGGSMQ